MIGVGDTVRLTEESDLFTGGDEERETAEVLVMLSDIPGGVLLSAPLNGIRYWNVMDLEKVS